MWAVGANNFFNHCILSLRNQKNKQKTTVIHVETRQAIIVIIDFLNFIKLFLSTLKCMILA